MNSTQPSPADFSAAELKQALQRLTSHLERFINKHGSAEVLAGSDSILAVFGVQRLAGVDVVIADGIELVDPEGVRDDVLIQGSTIYLSIPCNTPALT